MKRTIRILDRSDHEEGRIVEKKSLIGGVAKLYKKGMIGRMIRWTSNISVNFAPLRDELCPNSCM